MGGDSYLLLAGKINNQSLTFTDFSKRVFDVSFFLCFAHAGGGVGTGLQVSLVSFEKNSLNIVNIHIIIFKI